MEAREFKERDLVRHFKRELVDQTSLEYLYKIMAEQVFSPTWIIFKELSLCTFQE